jgi:hypothetical protein
MGWGRGRTARMWVVAAAAAALIFVSWWLLARGTRGAEIANVIALPAAVVAVVAALLALSPARMSRARFVGPALVAALAAAALIFVSWWLLARGTRGAEIANVLALPLAVITTAAGIWALSQQKEAVRARLEDSGGRGLLLVRAKQKIRDQLGLRVIAKSPRNDAELGPPDTRGPHIVLRFERRPDALTRGYKPVGHEQGQPRDEDETGLRQILADSHGLLVLGDIGSGKTTVLFELAQDLLPVPDELRDQPTPVDPKPIPVVLNLSAWGEQQESKDDDHDGTIHLPNTESKFEDWMVSALNVQYNIPVKLGRTLVHDDELLPLFDGLDEVSDRRRDMCIQAINGFGRSHLVDIVVSCRREEYEKIPTRLSFREAVVIRLPTLEEARAYLTDRGVQGILQDGVGNGGLQSLLSTPLMLDIVASVYAGQPEQSGDLVNMTGTLEQILGQILSAYEDRMLVLRPVPRYFWSDGARDQPPRQIEADWKFQTVLWLVWLARLMRQQAQNEFHLDRLQPNCLPNLVHRRLVVILPALCMGFVTTIIMTSIIAFSWPFTVAATWGLLGGVLMGLDGLGWRTLLRRHDRPVVDPVEEVRWKWSRARLAAGAGVGAAAGLAAGLIARLLGELRGLLHPQGVWDSSLLVLQQLGEWRAWSAICVAAIVACAVMSGLGGGLSKGLTVPNEGILRSARRAFGIGIPAGLFGGFVAGVVIRPIASVYTGVMMFFFFAFAVGLVFGGRACLRHIILRLLLTYNDFAPLRYNAFLQDSADRLFLRRSASGYTFVHQIIRDHFAKYYDPGDPPYARSILKALRALVRL